MHVGQEGPNRPLKSRGAPFPASYIALEQYGMFGNGRASMIEPEQCNSMKEVRRGVDALDEQIVIMLAKRFRFMNAAARIKEERHLVRDEERKAAVIEHARTVAANEGAPADVIAALYDTLIEASIKFELERFDER